MVKPRLVLVLGDQLNPYVSALRMADKERDLVAMAEVMAEATYVPHHPKKIALVFAAMRKFASALMSRRQPYESRENTGLVSAPACPIAR